MRTLAIMAATLGLVGTIAVGTQRLQQPRIGITATITAITTTVAEPGTAASLAGPFRAASVSPIAVVRGTCMDRPRATTDGGANISGAASLGGLFLLRAAANCVCASSSCSERIFRVRPS
jgi:hypothetical protein